MRLSDIEEAITLGKCTPELLEQFKTALHRSPKNMQPQHCFTTAAAMDAYARASSMLRSGSTGPLTALLKHKGYQESTGASKQARSFLKHLKKRLP